MKGEAINNIAKECLAKFFIKKKAQMPPDQFGFYLRSSLGPKAQDIDNRLNRLFSLSYDLVQLSLARLI